MTRGALTSGHTELQYGDEISLSPVLTEGHLSARLFYGQCFPTVTTHAEFPTQDGGSCVLPKEFDRCVFELLRPTEEQVIDSGGGSLAVTYGATVRLGYPMTDQVLKVVLPEDEDEDDSAPYLSFAQRQTHDGFHPSLAETFRIAPKGRVREEGEVVRAGEQILIQSVAASQYVAVGPLFAKSSLLSTLPEQAGGLDGRSVDLIKEPGIEAVWEVDAFDLQANQPEPSSCQILRVGDNVVVFHKEKEAFLEGISDGEGGHLVAFAPAKPPKATYTVRDLEQPSSAVWHLESHNIVTGGAVLSADFHTGYRLRHVATGKYLCCAPVHSAGTNNNPAGTGSSPRIPKEDFFPQTPANNGGTTARSVAGAGGRETQGVIRHRLFLVDALVENKGAEDHLEDTTVGFHPLDSSDESLKAGGYARMEFEGGGMWLHCQRDIMSDSGKYTASIAPRPIYEDLFAIHLADFHIAPALARLRSMMPLLSSAVSVFSAQTTYDHWEEIAAELAEFVPPHYCTGHNMTGRNHTDASPPLLSTRSHGEGGEREEAAPLQRRESLKVAKSPEGTPRRLRKGEKRYRSSSRTSSYLSVSNNGGFATAESADNAHSGDDADPSKQPPRNTSGRRHRSYEHFTRDDRLSGELGDVDDAHHERRDSGKSPTMRKKASSFTSGVSNTRSKSGPAAFFRRKSSLERGEEIALPDGDESSALLAAMQRVLTPSTTRSPLDPTVENGMSFESSIPNFTLGTPRGSTSSENSHGSRVILHSSNSNEKLGESASSHSVEELAVVRPVTSVLSTNNSGSHDELNHNYVRGEPIDFPSPTPSIGTPMFSTPNEAHIVVEAASDEGSSRGASCAKLSNSVSPLSASEYKERETLSPVGLPKGHSMSTSPDRSVDNQGFLTGGGRLGTSPGGNSLASAFTLSPLSLGEVDPMGSRQSTDVILPDAERRTPTPDATVGTKEETAGTLESTDNTSTTLQEKNTGMASTMDGASAGVSAAADGMSHLRLPSADSFCDSLVTTLNSPQKTDDSLAVSRELSQAECLHEPAVSFPNENPLSFSTANAMTFNLIISKPLDEEDESDLAYPAVSLAGAILFAIFLEQWEALGVQSSSSPAYKEGADSINLDFPFASISFSPKTNRVSSPLSSSTSSNSHSLQFPNGKVLSDIKDAGEFKRQMQQRESPVVHPPPLHHLGGLGGLHLRGIKSAESVCMTPLEQSMSMGPSSAFPKRGAQLRRGVGKNVRKIFGDLQEESQKRDIKRLLCATTAVLCDLVSFVTGCVVQADGSEENLQKQTHPSPSMSPPLVYLNNGQTSCFKQPYLPISIQSAILTAESLIVSKAPPIKARQKILFEQGLHHLIYQILAAPFDSNRLVLSDLGNPMYVTLHVILRLGYRLIMKIVTGYPQASSDVIQYMTFFERQSGHRLNATDTIHAIVHDHPTVLSSLRSHTIQHFVQLVPTFGRSPSYLNLLSAVCVCCGIGIARTQDLVCNEILKLQAVPGKQLLHRTRLVKRKVKVRRSKTKYVEPTFESRLEDDSAPHTTESWVYETRFSLEIELLAQQFSGSCTIQGTVVDEKGATKHTLHTTNATTSHGTFLDKNASLGSSSTFGVFGATETIWVSLQDFINSTDQMSASSVKYYERQLNLFASLCVGNEACSKKIADIIPEEHILFALEHDNSVGASVPSASRASGGNNGTLNNTNTKRERKYGDNLTIHEMAASFPSAAKLSPARTARRPKHSRTSSLTASIPVNTYSPLWDAVKKSLLALARVLYLQNRNEKSLKKQSIKKILKPLGGAAGTAGALGFEIDGKDGKTLSEVLTEAEATEDDSPATQRAGDTPFLPLSQKKSGYIQRWKSLLMRDVAANTSMCLPLTGRNEQVCEALRSILLLVDNGWYNTEELKELAPILCQLLDPFTDRSTDTPEVTVAGCLKEKSFKKKKKKAGVRIDSSIGKLRTLKASAAAAVAAVVIKQDHDETTPATTTTTASTSIEDDDDGMTSSSSFSDDDTTPAASPNTNDMDAASMRDRFLSEHTASVTAMRFRKATASTTQTSANWQQLLVHNLQDSLDEVGGMLSSGVDEITQSKLVACQILEAIQRQGVRPRDWSEGLTKLWKKTVRARQAAEPKRAPAVTTTFGPLGQMRTPASPTAPPQPKQTYLKGAHLLARIFLQTSMYHGNPRLFTLSFRLLCQCLADDDENFDLQGDFLPVDGEEEHCAVIQFATILREDVMPRERQLSSSLAQRYGVIVRYFVQHFSKCCEDTFCVCFILRVLTYLLKSEKREGEAAMRSMQCVLDTLGATLLMSSLIEAPNEEIVRHALLFGIALLDEGNLQVQKQLLNYFHSIREEAFFQCVRTRLHRAVTELKELEVMEKKRCRPDLAMMSLRLPISPVRIRPDSNLCTVTQTLRLLQLFCEGHNHELQCYIHEQPDNLHSVDLVKESFSVLKAAISVPPACFEDQLFSLMLQGFNSLTEYCQGPCKENQVVLVNAQLAREVSTVFRLDYEAATEGRISRARTDEMLNAATITLLSLLEGCENSVLPNTLMQTVDLMFLIGSTLDMCWRNRRRGSSSEHDTALELGFNLFIFMETLASFDTQDILQDSFYFMKDENGFAYFQAMTGRIEIAAREGRLQRVYFRIPELCLNLSKKTKRTILWAADRDTPASRLLSFFSMADDALFEMRYSEEHFSTDAMHKWQDVLFGEALPQQQQQAPKSPLPGLSPPTSPPVSPRLIVESPVQVSKLRAVAGLIGIFVHRRTSELHSVTVSFAVLLALMNAILMESHLQKFDETSNTTDPLNATCTAEPNDGRTFTVMLFEFLFILVGVMQLWLTILTAVHQAFSEGPILAHQQSKQEETNQWESRLSAEDLLRLRRDEDDDGHHVVYDTVQPIFPGSNNNSSSHIPICGYSDDECSNHTMSIPHNPSIMSHTRSSGLNATSFMPSPRGSPMQSASPAPRRVGYRGTPPLGSPGLRPSPHSGAVQQPGLYSSQRARSVHLAAPNEQTTTQSPPGGGDLSGTQSNSVGHRLSMTMPGAARKPGSSPLLQCRSSPNMTHGRKAAKDVDGTPAASPLLGCSDGSSTNISYVSPVSDHSAQPPTGIPHVDSIHVVPQTPGGFLRNESKLGSTISKFAMTNRRKQPPSGLAQVEKDSWSPQPYVPMCDSSSDASESLDYSSAPQIVSRTVETVPRIRNMPVGQWPPAQLQQMPQVSAFSPRMGPRRGMQRTLRAALEPSSPHVSPQGVETDGGHTFRDSPARIGRGAGLPGGGGTRPQSPALIPHSSPGHNNTQTTIGLGSTVHSHGRGGSPSLQALTPPRSVTTPRGSPARTRKRMGAMTSVLTYVFLKLLMGEKLLGLIGLDRAYQVWGGMRSRVREIYQDPVVGHYMLMMWYLVVDGKFVGHCFMVACSVLGLFVSPLFFTSQLFSVVSHSPILQSVIRSITKNGKSLLLTGLLAVIIVFHFAVAGFVFFKDSYQNSDEAAATIFRTFIHTLLNGIAKGGISDLMESPEFDGDGDGKLDVKYGFRMAFDFSFFVIVIVILLNIIFGIIIDTFAELRAEKQKVEDEIRTRCFICGIESAEFDRYASGFEHHIKRDHNMWAYIYFIHHLRTKEESEFTGQESYVSNKMGALDLSFFPANRAICLQNKTNANGEGQETDRRQGGEAVSRKYEVMMEGKLNEMASEQKGLAKKTDTTERRMRDMLAMMQMLQVGVEKCLVAQEDQTIPPSSRPPSRARTRGGSLRLDANPYEPQPGTARRIGSSANLSTGNSIRIPLGRQRSGSLVVPDM